MANNRAREMYWRRKEAGLCVRCGKDAEPGSIQCKAHQKDRNTYKRELHSRIVSAYRKAEAAKKRAKKGGKKR